MFTVEEKLLHPDIQISR